MEASRSDLEKFRGKVIESVEKFRSENEKYGYGTAQVNAFLDDLINLAHYYGKAGAQGSAKQPGVEAIRKEYNKLAESIKQEINSAMFTQALRGYDTLQVDNYLDHIIGHLDKYPEDGLERLDAETIKKTRFSIKFRGYDVSEVNRFMADLAFSIDGAKNIKDRYLGDGTKDE